MKKANNDIIGLDCSNGGGWNEGVQLGTSLGQPGWRCAKEIGS